jgi:hypothetical protein
VIQKPLKADRADEPGPELMVKGHQSNHAKAPGRKGKQDEGEFEPFASWKNGRNEH